MDTFDEEEDAQGQEYDEDDEPATRVAKPNSKFLARMLVGVTAVNKRHIDTTASKAARKAVGASGAASLRPVLARSVKQGPAAVRRAALTAAQQQKLTLCTSLLSEVALSFGFKLRVHGPDGGLLSPSGGLPSPTGLTSPRSTSQAQQPDLTAHQQQQQGEGGAGQEEGEEGEAEGAQGAGAGGPSRIKVVIPGSRPAGGFGRASSPEPLPLEELHVTLLPGGNLLGAAGVTGAAGVQGEEEEEGETRPGQMSRGTALLKAARPRLALNTLEGLGSALRRAAGTGPSPTAASGAMLQAARKRALLAKQAAAAAQDAPEDPEDPDGGTGTGNGAAGDEGGEEEQGTGTGIQAQAGAGKSSSKARIVWPTAAATAAGGGGGGGEQGDAAGGTQAVAAAGAVAAAAASTALRRVSSVTGQGAAAGGAAGTGGAAPRGGALGSRRGSAGLAGAGSQSMDDATAAPQGEAVAAGGGGGGGGAVPPASPPQPGSGGKRPATSGLNGLFSAALRDLKKVKQVVVDEGG